MPMSKDRVVAVMLAGGKGSRLYELTAETCKPAVAFAGGRRIVDWTMHNLAKANLSQVIVATQYRPTALVAHLNTHWRAAFAPGALTIRDGVAVTRRATGYVGTADAVTQNMSQIANSAPDVVLVVAADHIYSMNYNDIIAAHRASGRPVTVAVDRVPLDQVSSFGIVEVDQTGGVSAFVEKPSRAKPMAADPTRALASMGVYVFDWDWLMGTLSRDYADASSGHDFGHDILPVAVRAGSVNAFDVAAATPAFYWRDVGTLDALRQTCIELNRTASPCPCPPYPEPFILDLPTRILSNGTVVLPGAVVAQGAQLRNAIVAPGAAVPADLVAGFDPHADARHFRVTPDGTVLITARMLARRHTEARHSLPLHHSACKAPIKMSQP